MLVQVVLTCCFVGDSQRFETKRHPEGLKALLLAVLHFLANLRYYKDQASFYQPPSIDITFTMLNKLL